MFNSYKYISKISKLMMDKIPIQLCFVGLHSFKSLKIDKKSYRISYLSASL